jgi:2-oxoisovalerate dehydrogenase E2 component (dihydrolipoyl transacylase)
VADRAARPTAAPAVRLRAREAGIDLRLVTGTGPAGRVTHADLDAVLDGDGTTGPVRPRVVVADDGVEEVRLIGLRKRIAQRMAEANAHVPHITYVDEVDVTLLQQLRESLNADAGPDQPKLTLLPFVIAALVEAVRAHPQCNARFDDHEADGTGTLHIHRGVHVGIATQTDNGLVVPVVRHAETLDLFDAARGVDRLAAAARDGSATSAELSGSTITITSLGALGGLVTTPIVNRPEVAIVGINKLQVRPMWDGTAFVPRSMINVSSSFDHRIVDGWDAAQFVQVIKRRLEAPARLLLGPAGDPPAPTPPPMQRPTGAR